MYVSLLFIGFTFIFFGVPKQFLIFGESEHPRIPIAKTEFWRVYERSEREKSVQNYCFYLT